MGGGEDSLGSRRRRLDAQPPSPSNRLQSPVKLLPALQYHRASCPVAPKVLIVQSPVPQERLASRSAAVCASCTSPPTPAQPSLHNLRGSGQGRSCQPSRTALHRDHPDSCPAGQPATHFRVLLLLSILSSLAPPPGIRFCRILVSLGTGLGVDLLQTSSPSVGGGAERPGCGIPRRRCQ